MNNQNNTIHMVGNTHFDPVWLWTWDEAMASIRATFRSALDRMKEEPQFIYSFSSPPVFEWIRKTDPQMFEEIKQRVTKERWYLTEGMWVQPDCATASGESYVRQCLYAQRYLMEVFGRCSDTAFNVDSFGHFAMLPQILRKCGISNYVFGRPEPNDVELPSALFLWESPDGSRVKAYRTCELGRTFTCETAAEIDNVLNKLDSLTHDAMIIFGVSNHGGAPTRKAIAEILQKQIETQRVVFSDPGHFFAAQREEQLSVVAHELQLCFFGVFSNLPMMKKQNRLAETTAENAEHAALLCGMTEKTSYPAKELADCWKDILFNQFHDILGGASILEAYEDSRNLYGRSMQTSNEILHTSLQRIARGISVRSEDAPDVIWNLVFFNLNPFAVEQPIEAEVQWAWEFDWYQGEICVTDEQGIEYPCQLITARSVIPGFRSRFVFNASLPALGYRVFRVHQRAVPQIPERIKADAEKLILQNDWLQVKIDCKNGAINEITDIVSGKVLCRECAVPLVLEDISDVWAFDFKEYGKQEGFCLDTAEISEYGALRATIRTVSYCGHSRLEQRFTVYRERREVEGSYCVDWQEHHKTLKLLFAPAVSQPVLCVSTPYADIKRDFCGKELPVGEWLDVSQVDETGMTVMWDGIFAYDDADGKIRATVLRSPVCGDLRMEELEPSPNFQYLSQGITTGKWRACFHKQKAVRDIWQECKAFVNPPVMVLESNHDGSRPQIDSFLSLEGEGVWITTCKGSEDGEDMILRLQNVTDCAQQITVTRGKTENSGTLHFDAYEIKTIRWPDHEKPIEVSMLETPIL